MATYKLSETAKIDLIRIHQYGVARFGEAQTDKYYFAFFDQFKINVNHPLLFQTVDDIRPGYRAYVALIVYTTVLI